MNYRIPSGDPIDNQFIKRLFFLAAFAALVLLVKAWLEYRSTR